MSIAESETFSNEFRVSDQRNMDPFDGGWSEARAALTLVYSGPDYDFKPETTSEPLQRLIVRWVRAASAHARTRPVERHLWVADVVTCPGAWAEGRTAEAALAALPSVLDEWVRMKLDDGDRDIPSMEGWKLVIDE